MASKTLLPLTDTLGPGPIQSFPGADNIRIFQVTPRKGVSFSGSFDIEESYAASPGSGDFQRLSTITFTAHAGNFALNVESDAPWVRVNLKTATSGQIAVFGTSRSGSIQGGSGTSASQATAIVDGPKKSGVIGNDVHITSPIVPQITSDDVAYATNINDTVTDVLDTLVTFNDELITANTTADDVAVLSGVSTADPALTNQDMLDLAQYQPTVTEVNYSVGLTSNIQTQLDDLDSGKADGAGVDITGWATDVSYVNSFFDADPDAFGISVSSLSASLGGLNSTSADLNVLQGVGSPTAPDTVPVADDFWKLAAITASADEISSLSGFTGTSTDLNKIALVTSSAADLSAIDGLAGTGVTTTEISLLDGLTENVQNALNDIPDLAGLTASTTDLNILDGAALGTGSYGDPITASNVSHLFGVTSNIQSQFTNKRDKGVDIGIDEISGAAITTIELNYLQGADSNIQAQIDLIGGNAVTIDGRDVFTDQFFIYNGTALNPGLGTSGQDNTGLYLEGVGLGISTQGARVASFTGSVFNLGDAASDGQPEMAFTGMGESKPAYSFQGNAHTGMTWLSDKKVGIIAGGEAMIVADKLGSEVTLGGDAASNNAVTVPGVAGFEKVLGTADVDGMDDGAGALTPIFTVGAGRTAIVTKILVIIKASDVDTAGVDDFRMNIGTEAANDYEEIVDNVNNFNIFTGTLTYSFSTAGQVKPLGLGANSFDAIAGSDGNDYGIITATKTVTANVITAPTTVAATTFDLTLVVFGYEY